MNPKTLLIAALVGTSVSASAEVIKYTYDEAGNRILREPGVNRIAVVPLSAKNNSQSDLLSGKSITISAEGGTVRMDIPGFTSTDTGTIGIYTVPGQQLAYGDIKSAETVVDISANPNGIYIVSVKLNGQSRSWKIIKR